jgi:hypothetical protein
MWVVYLVTLTLKPHPNQVIERLSEKRVLVRDMFNFEVTLCAFSWIRILSGYSLAYFGFGNKLGGPDTHRSSNECPFPNR